jgi:hypothetical protein
MKIPNAADTSDSQVHNQHIYNGKQLQWLGIAKASHWFGLAAVPRQGSGCRHWQGKTLVGQWQLFG